jgi:uncharacterized protein YegP (UPF0339 family)
MITFRYTFLPRLLYRYSVIPVNLLLLFYLFVSILVIERDWKFIFPLLINVIILYILNRFYLKMYKSFPFQIKANNEEIICSDFVFKKKSFAIRHIDIVEIKGGIFSGRMFAPLYISTKDITIGISQHIKNYNELLKIILSNIPSKLYVELLETMQKNAISNIPISKKKKHTKTGK